MTVRKVWLGSTGPFLYDDSVLYIDEDGVISPDNQQAIATDGQIVIQSPPSSPVHAVRKQDLDDALGDISTIDGRLTSLEAQVAQHSIDIGDLQTRMGATESAISSISSTVSNHGPRITSLETRVTTLEGNFIVGSFQLYIHGFATTPRTPTVAYSISDRYVAITIPGVDDTGGTNFIDLGNLPESVANIISGLAEIPVLAYDATFGYDWCSASFTADGFWKIRILPRIKAAAFNPGVRRILPQQSLTWPRG